MVCAAETDPYEKYAQQFATFTDASPTVYHANAVLARELEAQGFERLEERADWTQQLASGSRFYVSRGSTVLLAFVKGAQWEYTNGCAIVGTHIDSLAAVLKPTSIKEPVEGFELIGVAPYSGGLCEQWWDRDLGIGGRLLVREGDRVAEKLVHIPHPVARIATLAPHFGKPSEPPFNMETQKVPFIGLVGEGGLPTPTAEEQQSPAVGKHSLQLLRALSEESGVPVKDFITVDLHLFDTQPAVRGGLHKEFIFAPRVDNKACTYTALHGLFEAADDIEQGDSLAVWVAYDSEEIGSLTRTGAQGNLLEAVLARLLADPGTQAPVLYANSFFVSADVTHAVNPNFTGAYLAHHAPRLNGGIALKFNANGRNITDAASHAFFVEIARRTQVPLQQFQTRNDTRTGGTIGPFVASRLGLRGVDLGVPQLAMHSIRETLGARDVYNGVRLFKAFYATWRAVDAEFRAGGL